MSSDQAVKPTINDVLHRENAPLRSFWSKIKLSYAFGFINPNLHDALEMIRKLRNSFAHQHEPVELSTKVAADLIRKLARHEQMAVRAFSTVFSEWATEDIEKLRSALGGPIKSLEAIVPLPRGFNEVRLKFTIIIALLWSNLKKIELAKEAGT